MTPTDPLEIEATDLKRMMEGREPMQLVDVRAPWEHSIVALEGDLLVPLPSLGARVAELDRARKVVLYCHHGSRSWVAARALRDAGYDAVSLRGGIDGWARTIDPSLPKY